jgi:hypothetical protein
MAPGERHCHDRQRENQFHANGLIVPYGDPVKLVDLPADKVYMDERRSEVRMLCADMIEVSWKDTTGQCGAATALLEDISASGACLQLETAIPLASEIRWNSPKQEFQGHVRYCVYREIGYFVGVEFASKVRWSTKKYKPQHLLNLERLLVQSKK